MSDDNSSKQLDLATEIVAAYVGRNQTAADQLPVLISTVYQTLGRLGKSTVEPLVERIPAVSARRSVHRDYVICMDCGFSQFTVPENELRELAYSKSLDQVCIQYFGLLSYA